MLRILYTSYILPKKLNQIKESGRYRKFAEKGKRNNIMALIDTEFFLEIANDILVKYVLKLIHVDLITNSV